MASVSPQPPHAASVPSQAPASPPPSSSNQATPSQPSQPSFVTPATTPQQSATAGGGAASLQNLFNYPGPVASANVPSSTPSSGVDVSPLTSSEGFERAPAFPANLVGPPRPSSAAANLPAGPGGFGRHREMVYSRPELSRPSSAQSWNDEKAPADGDADSWQTTVRGPAGGPSAAMPRSTSLAGGLVVNAPNGPGKARSRPHSFHAGMVEADANATIRGPPGGGTSSSYQISDFLDPDPMLFDGGLPTATPGLVASEGSEQQAAYMQMHQQRPASSGQAQHGQSPAPSFYPPPPPSHQPAPFAQRPAAPYYADDRLRHSQPNVHSSPYNGRPDPRFAPQNQTPRSVYAAQQASHHQMSTPQHSGYSSSAYGPSPSQPMSRSGGGSMHHRPSLPFPAHPGASQMQQRSHSMNAMHPSSASAPGLDPSALRAHYRHGPDGSDWSTSSAGEGDSAGESWTSQSGAEGEEEMKEMDELDDDEMRGYPPSQFVGGAIAGGPQGLMRMGGEYSDEEDDLDLRTADPRYRQQGHPDHKRQPSGPHQYGPGPSRGGYYQQHPQGGQYPSYGGQYGSSPPPQPMYPISAYGIQAPQQHSDGHGMYYHPSNGGPPRKQRLVKTSKIPAPVPVPHLNKRSRGRHVPIDPKVVRSKKGGNGRVYECMVTECGKCFGRSEHLKRSVRVARSQTTG